MTARQSSHLTIESQVTSPFVRIADGDSSHRASHRESTAASSGVDDGVKLSFHTPPPQQVGSSPRPHSEPPLDLSDLDIAEPTCFAVRAIDLSQALKIFVADNRADAFSGASVILTEPHGHSTGGGVQTLQHLTLACDVLPGITLVVGSADTKSGTAELRSYQQLARTYRQRSRDDRFPLAEHRYRRITGKLREFFDRNSMSVRETDSTSEPHSGAISPVFVVLAIAAVAAVCGVAAAALLGA